MKILLICALAAATIASGCATPESSTEPAARRERVFTTGSNIPRRGAAQTDGVQVTDRESFERQRDQMPPMQRAGPGGGPPS